MTFEAYRNKLDGDNVAISNALNKLVEMAGTDPLAFSQ